ncbi:cytochrome c family protein [Crateriforma conspicua]|uniref:Perchlorate reductase subunit gamma n=1 Tax=Crateriforma conspicua TaxID=2527996 RepID=A0A5C5XR98_9PLAN|nr:cytochrome c family protein [Crateriforma conspicua]TWT65747.1 Perchlorate reductase subunit gamma precursor [Crateriforma conspicua]
MLRVILVFLIWVASLAVADAAGPATRTSDASSGGSSRGDFDLLLHARPADPAHVLGNDACVKCHANEINVWKKTPHATTFDELHRRPEARQIARNLKLRSIKHDGRCVACHYTQQQTDQGSLAAIAGVSCESCHAAAKQWLDIHHDYGSPETTRQSESPAHRAERLRRSIAAGMRNPDNVYLVAQSCYRCHTTADEELVNVGGHSAGSEDFEFVAWSQGSIRHNFVRSDGAHNQTSDVKRLRVMFVAGMLADLEASLTATAQATQKAKYGVTAAGRTARAAKRLRSVSEKIDDPYVAASLKVFDGVQLKLNNRESLNKAAQTIAKLGYLFAAKNDGSSLSPLDPFIPPPETWK